MNENQNQGQQMQIELSQEVATGQYINLALINHSSSEFVIDLASILPGLPKAQIRSRAILSPEHAKRLLMALQDNVLKYESQFGKIQLPNQSAAPKTVSPFKVKPTDA